MHKNSRGPWEPWLAAQTKHYTNASPKQQTVSMKLFQVVTVQKTNSVLVSHWHGESAAIKVPDSTG